MARRLYVQSRSFPRLGLQPTQYFQHCLGFQDLRLLTSGSRGQQFFWCADYSDWQPGFLWLECKRSIGVTDVTGMPAGVMMVFQVNFLVNEGLWSLS